MTNKQPNVRAHTVIDPAHDGSSGSLARRLRQSTARRYCRFLHERASIVATKQTFKSMQFLGRGSGRLAALAELRQRTTDVFTLQSIVRCCCVCCVIESGSVTPETSAAVESSTPSHDADSPMSLRPRPKSVSAQCWVNNSPSSPRDESNRRNASRSQPPPPSHLQSPSCKAPSEGEWLMKLTLSEARQQRQRPDPCMKISGAWMNRLLQEHAPSRERSRQKQRTATKPFPARLQLTLRACMLEKEVSLGTLIDLRLGTW